MQSLIIFASGTGTNADAIIQYFKGNGKAKVALIVSNKADAGVLDIARREEIPFLIIDKKTFNETLLVEQIADYKPSLIVLAGFLWKIPRALITQYPDRIINIHPALLPGYGGKGMYGARVHDAVIAAGDKESAISTLAFSTRASARSTPTHWQPRSVKGRSTPPSAVPTSSTLMPGPSGLVFSIKGNT